MPFCAVLLPLDLLNGLLFRPLPDSGVMSPPSTHYLRNMVQWTLIVNLHAAHNVS